MNVLYFKEINSIGGVETFFHELVKKYSNNHDITIVYQIGDIKQIKRLEQFVPVIKYFGQVIECDKVFFNYGFADVIDNFKANEYYQIVHTDYQSTAHMGYKPITHPRLNGYIAVSKQVAKSFKELTGIECEVIYNPLKVEEERKPLLLVSATRLTKEKGRDLMIELGNQFDRNNIPYLWLIFTDDTNKIDNPNIIYMNPRLDIRGYIAKCDYLVQLSKGEAYCYSIVEALSLGVPIISTDLPVLKEMGVNDKHGFILNFDLSNLDVNAIYNKKFNFKYTPVKDTWGDKLSLKGETKPKQTKVIFHFDKIICNGAYKSTLSLIQRLYLTHDISVVYNEYCDRDVLVELLRYVPVNALVEHLYADICIKVTLGNEDGLITANKKYQWIHSDIKTLNSSIRKRADIDKYITVSEYNKEQVDSYLDVDSMILYNDVDIDIETKANEEIELPNHDLKLVSVTRLSDEKGFEYILKMVDKLIEVNIDFKWYIVGSANKEYMDTNYRAAFKDYPQIEFVGTKLNPYPYIKWADYLVAPSTRETWHLGVSESLYLNTPVIVNDIPVFHEQVVDGKNGYIFDFANDKFDVKTILKRPTFKHTPRTHFKGWYSFIGDPIIQSITKSDKVLVRAYTRFTDRVAKSSRVKDETWVVDKDRCVELKLKNAPIEILKIYH